jgi:hypothetical protein
MLVECMGSMVLQVRLERQVLLDFLVLLVSFLVPAEVREGLVVLVVLEHVDREAIMLLKQVM